MDIVDHPWGEWQEWAIANPDRVPGTQSRWSAGKDLSFTPLRPELVLEVKYDAMEGNRFRHTAHFKRWRTDRDPESCGYEQLEQPVSYDLTKVLGMNPSEVVMNEYDVILLVEQAFTATDATNVRSLHEDIEDPVRYHVMLPVEDASARVENAMGSLATGEVLATPPVAINDDGPRGTAQGAAGHLPRRCGGHGEGDRGGRGPGQSVSPSPMTRSAPSLPRSPRSMRGRSSS